MAFEARADDTAGGTARLMRCEVLSIIYDKILLNVTHVTSVPGTKTRLNTAFIVT